MLDIELIVDEKVATLQGRGAIADVDTRLQLIVDGAPAADFVADDCADCVLTAAGDASVAVVVEGGVGRMTIGRRILTIVVDGENRPCVDRLRGGGASPLSMGPRGARSAECANSIRRKSTLSHRNMQGS